MKQLVKFYGFVFYLILGAWDQNHLFAQCTPAFAETCEESLVFCSLSEMSGYACFNGSSKKSHCSPLCSAGGAPDNTTWWGFVSQGGQATITLQVGDCSILNNGLQWGIWADCICGEEILCSVNCIQTGNSDSRSVSLIPCKTYYLWVDGCNNDLCDFTLNTSGGAAPTLTPLGFINNKTNSVIEPVCMGIRNYLFFVNPQPGACKPTYIWTLDGIEVGNHDNEIRLDFSDYGDFNICVTAYIGNPLSGSICSQQGPRCATVKVRQIADKPGIARTLCWEATRPSGYKWHSKKIFFTGTYKEQFSDPAGCTYDSVVDFKVLDIPEKPDVFYISCDNIPFVDLLGRSYTACQDHLIINLPKTTDPFKCDSGIVLTAVNINFIPKWKIQCLGGQVELSPNISIVKACNAGESYQFNYRWYKKNDPAKTILSTDERLLVSAVSDAYCVDVDVIVELGDQTAHCRNTFCEAINENDLMPNELPINGDKIICVNGIGTYWIDTLITGNVLNYNWTVDGGMVLTKKDSSAIEVQWLLAPDDTGTVCFYYDADCGRSIERCIKVTFDKLSVGKDFKQPGRIAHLNSPSVKTGHWKLITGPGMADFENENNPKSRVQVSVYGLYCFEWVANDTNCFSKYSICIEFYKLKFFYYDYPHFSFDKRNNFLYDPEMNSFEIYTPNLISKNGSSYLFINGDINSPIHYRWVDLNGNNILEDSLPLVSGIQRTLIKAPVQEGFYILVFEINEAYILRKVCIMD